MLEFFYSMPNMNCTMIVLQSVEGANIQKAKCQESGLFNVRSLSRVDKKALQNAFDSSKVRDTSFEESYYFFSS